MHAGGDQREQHVQLIEQPMLEQTRYSEVGRVGNASTDVYGIFNVDEPAVEAVVLSYPHQLLGKLHHLPLILEQAMHKNIELLI